MLWQWLGQAATFNRYITIWPGRCITWAGCRDYIQVTDLCCCCSSQRLGEQIGWRCFDRSYEYRSDLITDRPYWWTPGGPRDRVDDLTGRYRDLLLQNRWTVDRWVPAGEHVCVCVCVCPQNVYVWEKYQWDEFYLIINTLNINFSNTWINKVLYTVSAGQN